MRGSLHSLCRLLICALCVFFCSEAAMVQIMHILASAASKAHTRETCATFIKFSSPETMQVSRHPGLKTAAGLLGLCT